MRNLLYFPIIAALFLGGCGKKDQPAGRGAQNSQVVTDSVSANAAAMPATHATVSVSTPVLQPILTAWQEGHTEEAVELFAKADWSARPIFPQGMAVGLNEAQFKAMSDADRQLRNNEMLAQLDVLKQLATAVNAAGDQAASKGDNLRARQCYESLKQFGAALSNPQAQQLLQMVGQVSRNMGEQGLGRLKT